MMMDDVYSRVPAEQRPDFTEAYKRIVMECKAMHVEGLNDAVVSWALLSFAIDLAFQAADTSENAMHLIHSMCQAKLEEMLNDDNLTAH